MVDELTESFLSYSRLINKLRPGSVKKINTMKMPFKQRENIELYLKGCEEYGLKTQDLFQVNDLFENKNLYMVVDNLFSLGGQAQKVGFSGPHLGVKKASENRRSFDEEVLKAGQSVIGLQYGSNKGASQAGMTAYGTGRQIRPDGKEQLRVQISCSPLSFLATVTWLISLIPIAFVELLQR